MKTWAYGLATILKVTLHYREPLCSSLNSGDWVELILTVAHIDLGIHRFQGSKCPNHRASGRIRCGYLDLYV